MNSISSKTRAHIGQLLLLPLLVLVLGLLVTYALWRNSQSTLVEGVQREFNFHATEAADLVRARVASHEQVLHGLRGLFMGSASVDREEFRQYVSSLELVSRFPGVLGMGYIELVPDTRKEQHIAAVRSEGFADYNIHPKGKRTIYAPVVYIEPFTGRNLRAFGYDAYSEPERRATMERARDTNQATLTSHLTLVQHSDARAHTGFIMLLPLYRQGVQHENLADRRASLFGWVYATFRADALMAGVLGKGGKEIDIEIFDGDETSARALLYDSDGVLRADGRSGSRFRTIRKLAIGGRNWTMLINSLPAFEARLDTSKSQLIAQGGPILSILLALLSGVLMRSRLNSIQATRLLEQELRARKQAEESLRQAALIYESSSEGMLITDAENRIIAVNPAFTHITGFTLEEVCGKDPSCMSSGRHDARFYEAMWAELDRTGHWQGEIWDRRKDGEPHAKYMTINTIYAADGTVYRRVALFLDITAQKETEEFIWRQANFDPLTGLPNRSMFRERLEHEIKKAQRTKLIFALLFIDLDLFKEVNDTLGHHMGDLLLLEAAKRITVCVRDDDTVARLGGDEFTVILSELHDSGNVERVATSILERLAAPYQLGENIVHVTGSIGITLYPRDAADAEGLLKNADQAMYVAKNMGRNRSSYFTPALQEAAQTRLHLINDLRTAITERQFSVYYQPIVDLRSGEVNKAEALVRWQHPRRGLVNPNDFIPLAEETGLISKIGDWVFLEAASQARRLRAAHHPQFQISVNKSPKQFRETGATFTAWFDHLRALQLPGDGIAIEITEGLLLNAVSEVTEKLEAFREAGISIAIDDFGTGYSSLAYLKRFDIDFLKIDRTFVRDIENDANDLALSQAIIVMAHALGLKVIAEGVETERQLQLLTDAGCDYAQGYLFAKPMPAEQFEAMLRDKRAQAWRQRASGS